MDQDIVLKIIILLEKVKSSKEPPLPSELSQQTVSANGLPQIIELINSFNAFF